MKNDLTFNSLSVGGIQRLKVFKNRRGEVAHAKPDGSDWTIAEWTNAMAGECGEACNIAKKLRRGDFGITSEEQKQAVDALMEELADVVIYADLCAQRVGRNLGDAVRDKFNKKSEDINVDVFI